MQIYLLTALTMTAFAANSVLGRIALRMTDIDPASYVSIRLMSGALILAVLAGAAGRNGKGAAPAGDWLSALALFAYAASFSFAYLGLDAGTGALILFATVQASIIGWSLYCGGRPSVSEWCGLAVAFAALVWLLAPGVAAPDPFYAALMTLAGIAWGIYTIRGKAASNPLRATAGNFMRSVPLTAILSAWFFSSASLPLAGIALAACSGAVTSGLGYALWYRVLKSLSPIQSGMVQLSVPVIAAVGGILFLGEPLTLRFAACSCFILGGIGFAIAARRR